MFCKIVKIPTNFGNKFTNDRPNRGQTLELFWPKFIIFLQTLGHCNLQRCCSSVQRTQGQLLFRHTGLWKFLALSSRLVFELFKKSIRILGNVAISYLKIKMCQTCMIDRHLLWRTPLESSDWWMLNNHHLWINTVVVIYPYQGL